MTILSPTYTLNDLHRLSRALQEDGIDIDEAARLVAWAAGMIEAFQSANPPPMYYMPADGGPLLPAPPQKTEQFIQAQAEHIKELENALAQTIWDRDQSTQQLEAARRTVDKYEETYIEQNRKIDELKEEVKHREYIIKDLEEKRTSQMHTITELQAKFAKAAEYEKTLKQAHREALATADKRISTLENRVLEVGGERDALKEEIAVRKTHVERVQERLERIRKAAAG